MCPPTNSIKPGRVQAWLLAHGERIAHRLDATGQAMREFEPRTLQQNLLVVIYWLVAALALFYWIS